MAKYVYDFSEGDMTQKDLLGGKGANLCEMTRLGLPVPPGFIISTDACRVHLREGKPPAYAGGRGRRTPGRAREGDGPQAR